jgi:ribosomal protein L37AE/L43A
MVALLAWRDILRDGALCVTGDIHMNGKLEQTEDIRQLDIGQMALGGFCEECKKQYTVKRTSADVWTFKCGCKFTFFSTKGHIITRPLNKEEYEEYKKWKQTHP